MKKHYKYLLSLLVLATFTAATGFAQSDRENISVRSEKLSEAVYLLSCVNGFGGGNVLASAGEDGVLLVDNMFAWMAPKLESAVKTLSDKPVRIVLNTHFHKDHIEGNSHFRKTAVIIAHQNVPKQLQKNSKDAVATEAMLPKVIFPDRLSINFNGEEIQIIHSPESHTDSDAIIFFSKSKVLHLGDMFFFGMFPGVYAQGGGNIKNLITQLEKILIDFPQDTKVIPGHGDLATMKDLAAYVAMLKKTVSIVEAEIRNGTTLEQMKTKKVLSEFDALGSGGAQTTEQYLAMLFGLLTNTGKKQGS